MILGLTVWPVVAVAQSGDGAARDSVYQSDLVRPIAPVDTSAQVVRTDGGGVKRVVREAGPFHEPRYVMLRSLVFPGWGQFYNRQWIKGVLVAGVEVALIVRLWQDDKDLTELERAVNDARDSGDNAAEEAAILAFNDKLDSYVARQWFLAGVVTYAIVDAYVDAHFRNFDVDFAVNPGTGGSGSGDAGMRMALRWSF